MLEVAGKCLLLILVTGAMNYNAKVPGWQDVLLSRIPRQYLVPWNSPTPSSVLSQDEEIALGCLVVWRSIESYFMGSLV